MTLNDDTSTEKSMRVVVTGMGAVTSLGTSVEALWAGIKSGQVGIRPVQNLPMDSYLTSLGGEVQEKVASGKTYPLCITHGDLVSAANERVLEFALQAGEEACDASGKSLQNIPAERWGVVIGTCMGGLSSASQWYKAYLDGVSASPECLLLFPPQSLAEIIGSVFGVKGPIISLSTACAAGANAIGYAADLIRSGQADVVLAGGTDALSDVTFAGFHALESLSPRPAAPYSRNRQGLSLGEGSGMLVLMRADLAEQLGVPMLAEILGYGLSADGYHPTAPDPYGRGAKRAIQAALKVSGVLAEQVQYVNGHGTGTAKNDSAETKAIRLALGAAAEQVKVSSSKSMIGHLLGAAGTVESIIAIKALQEQLAPPTANYDSVDPECDLDYVPNVSLPLPMNVAISNNFAFGGNNACLVLGKGDLSSASPATPGNERVVVTGISTLTSAGCTLDEVWEAFAKKQSSIQTKDGKRVAWVENLDPSPFLTVRDRRRMDRLSIFSVVATHLALANAALEVTDENRHDIGILFGSGLGPMESMEKFCKPLFSQGTAAASPGVFPNTVFNAAAGQVAIHVGTLGPNSTVTTGHGAGASAICYGYDQVANGLATAMVCLAVDTLTDAVVQAYSDLGILSPKSSFALAEGGVALLLESLSSARKRGARIYGEITGYGMAADGHGIGNFDRHDSGVRRAMCRAVQHAGIDIQKVNAIWANQSGFRPSDLAETTAIHQVFQESETLPVIYTPKTLFGEPVGVGGALNTALALKSWQCEQPSSPGEQKYALINSSTLGGTHFSLLLRSYQEEEIAL
ncbi:beta-ketoacyl-[acyl-carrier-protein] synthase family protein [Tengunoibacter tsumagoiensis]|uniref:Ketosynthase family 3 (KS3) domain-containing protein n=1 Tax=Tengunoibacter tsumagoiensis TaxID=2014871 RepID=A0A402A709_9CHLR|nr:beta-ketoacyl-[acyl-carrier-protein] synthase family protein [Tengunoibacter tsumagoiensis]GCE14922.1 hypothetical protein KTT_47810 [Tengunoibacter tsumagoiensis]